MGRSAVGSEREVAITGVGCRLPGGLDPLMAPEPVAALRREPAREAPAMDVAAADDLAGRVLTLLGTSTGGP